ncbi:MAG: hypothetical protein A2139_12030 [Desulfobacca sp. RBG_16_60_12]|nr:MAG: hypothetical protein A2139_12030 [Desulfobacca sp. RBG_16_60_12]
MLQTMPSGLSFREQRAFERLARDLVRLPGPGEGPLSYLLPEARWRELTHGVPDETAWLMALSRATGVYFFPSREFVLALMRYLKLLRVTRLLEAGAGRGYLTAALTPLSAAAGIRFRAVDRGDGEFVSGLPVYAGVETDDALAAAREFEPQVVLYAWPPPGQSVGPLCQMPFLHYLIVIGEAGGGATGAREDWESLPHRVSPALCRYGRGRTGALSHRVTVFYGGGNRPEAGAKSYP